MVTCPKCNVDYEESRKFCIQCGTQLKQKTDSIKNSSGDSEKQSPDYSSQNLKICPECKSEYDDAKLFCKACGSSLIKKSIHHSNPPMGATTASNEPSINTLSDMPSRFHVKSLIRKRKKLLHKSNKIAILVKNLKQQKDVISEEMLNTTLEGYQVQLNSFKTVMNEIDNFLNELQRNATAAITDLEEQIKPFLKRLQELKIMKKAKGITLLDYLKAKKEPSRTSKKLNRQIRKRRRMLNLLDPSSMSKVKIINPLLFIVPLIVVFFLSGIGYFGYNYLSSKKHVNPQLSPEEEIHEIFNKIKQAHLSENIDIFMECYSSEFPEYAKKRNQTINTWEDFDFKNVSFALRNLNIDKEKAEVTADWIITAYEKTSDKLRDIRVTNNVFLQKEDGQWKIADLH